MIANLGHIRAALKTELRLLSGMSGLPDEHSILLWQAVELAKQCIAEGENLCKLAQLSPSIEAPQWELPLGRGLEPPSGTSGSGIETGEPEELRAYRRLSPREHAVLQLLADGKNNKEVGAVLGISVRTAEAYRARMMNKVEVHSLAQLVRFAVRNKIIEP
jgi:DNA-binding NarL/FixJ family response regulator